MRLELERTTIHSFPHAFVTRRGEPILVTTLDDKRCEQLTAMYLKYEPRGSFQGLPPLKDEMCVRWVNDMIAHAVNLVALSFGEGVVGHVAMFPIDNRTCEMLVVVSPEFQNVGIGTELVQCLMQLADELNFEKIRLTVERRNTRARHVYKKCGFDYTSPLDREEMGMEADLRRNREALDVTVEAVMNSTVVAIRDDRPCREALELFLKYTIGSVPVVDSEGRLVGILSKTDLMAPGKISKTVSEVLTRDVLTVTKNCRLEKVIRILQGRRIRAVPLIDRDRKVIGVIGRGDILAYYARHADQ